MLVPTLLDQRFKDAKAPLQYVERRAKESIFGFCEKHNFAFVSRFKSVESLAEKIETGRFGRWSQLDDLWAATIIVPTLSDEKAGIDFCHDVFEVLSFKARGETKKAPDVFRFDSPRLTCKLKGPPGADSSELPPFEVQVRSAFEHAWSVTTHALSYKTNDVDWKRTRLAAQLRASVEQLDMLILAFEATYPSIVESRWPQTDQEKLVCDLVNRLGAAEIIPGELLPYDLSRFCENIVELFRKADVSKDLPQTLTALEAVLMNKGAALVPKSVSLYQWFIAELHALGTFPEKFPRKHFWHITQELEVLYPSLKAIPEGWRFSYSK